MGGDDRQVVILLQVRADEVLEPCVIWQGASAGCMAIPRQGVEHRGRVQGVAAGDRISGTGSVGLPEWFDKPGQEVQRHVSMRVSVLGDRFPGPG
jgi:hypothetical protein